MSVMTRTRAGRPDPANANARRVAGAGKRLESARKLQSRSRLVKQLELLRRRVWQGNVTARASTIKIMEETL